MAEAATELALPSADLRRIMVDRQVRTFDVTDQLVTARFLAIPREDFVGVDQRALAYSDLAIELSGDAGPRSRILLPPFVIARMLQSARPVITDRVLDVAGGTGYTAALLAGLVKEVIAVESDESLRARAQADIAALGFANVHMLGGPVASLAANLPQFDLIFVNGGVEEGLRELADRLTPDGRIVAIVPKPSGVMMAALITGRDKDLSVRPLFDAQAPILDEFRRKPTFVL